MGLWEGAVALACVGSTVAVQSSPGVMLCGGLLMGACGWQRWLQLCCGTCVTW